MRTLLIIAALLLAGCKTPDGKFIIPIQGKICYTASGVRYCIGSDGKVILLDGEITGYKK